MTAPQRVSLALVSALAFITLPAQTGQAEPCAGITADEARTQDARLRRLLSQQARHLDTWSLSWAAGFAGVSVGAGVLASTVIEDRGRQIDLYVTMSKAALGVAAEFVLPIEAARPAPATGEPCRDLLAARSALALTAKRQRRGKRWLPRVESLAVNAVGVTVAGTQHGHWFRALGLAALGYAVGEVKIYTQPDRGIHAHRTTPVWTVLPAVTDDRVGLALMVMF